MIKALTAITLLLASVAVALAKQTPGENIRSVGAIRERPKAEAR